MKKKLCMVLAAMLTAGSVSVYGAEAKFTEIPHTFTAKVGTTELIKDGEAQLLDVEIYIKDGYTMLPLRTFLNAALEKATMHWENGTAIILHGWNIFTFDVINNKIMKNGTEIPVYGKMEVKDGRVFVPLRNWGNILNMVGSYWVGEEDIVWKSEEKTAEIYAVERKVKIEVIEAGLEGTAMPYKGQEAVFACKLMQDFDELENVGDGYFIAQKYAEDGFGLGEGVYSRENQYVVLNVETGEIKEYEKGTSLREVREEWLSEKQDKADDAECADRCMKGIYRIEEVVELPNGDHKHIFTYYDETGEISYAEYQLRKGLFEGLAPWYDAETEKYGYVNENGVWVIAPAFDKAEPFQDGYAVVANEITRADGVTDAEWGVILHPNP